MSLGLNFLSKILSSSSGYEVVLSYIRKTSARDWQSPSNLIHGTYNGENKEEADNDKKNNHKHYYIINEFEDLSVSDASFQA